MIDCNINPVPNNIDPKLKVTINCPSNGTDSGYIDMVVDGTGTGAVIITVQQDDIQKAGGKSYPEFTLINGTVRFDTTDRYKIQEIEEQHVSAGQTYRFQFIDLNKSNFDCSREEMRVLTRDDVEFVNEGVKIFVKKSKSDQSGEGMTKAIPSFKYVEYCPVDHLKNWMVENKNDLVFPISDKNVALIIKKHAY